MNARAARPPMPGGSGVRVVTRSARPRFRFNPAYAFIAPSVLILSVFTVWPIAQAFWMSLHDWSFTASVHPFEGLGNYFTLFGDPLFWNAVRTTLVYTLATVPFQIGIALMLAIALNGKIRGRAFLRSAYFVPVISSVAVMAIVWMFLFDPDIGLVSAWLLKLGFGRIAFLREPGSALVAVILVGIWKAVGFNMVLLLAGLQGVSKDQHEAAALDGANSWQQFRHVTLPALRHQLLFVAVISIIASLQAFDQIFVMTRGGPLHSTETLVYYAYQNGFAYFQMGYASAISVILFLFIAVVSLVQLRLFRYQEMD
jgi:ABC-type sugar transport system permease subunit